MKTSSVYYIPVKSSGAEAAAAVTLGLAGFVSIIFAALAMVDFVNGRPAIVAHLENPGQSAVLMADAVTNTADGNLVARPLQVRPQTNAPVSVPSRAVAAPHSAYVRFNAALLQFGTRYRPQL